MKQKNTLRLLVDSEDLLSAGSMEALKEAASILQNGGTVAFPTETVYGLGANAFDEDALKKIFEAKQRPFWDPLIVHVASESQMQAVVESVPEKAQLLMDAFWPGPLTLLLPRRSRIPSMVTAGLPRVGVRMPAHPVAKRLIELAGVPVAAPSANSFGRTSPTSGKSVLEDLDGRIDALLDAGPTPCGLESTVLDVCDEKPVLYRPGMVTREQLEAVCGEVLTRSQNPSVEGAAVPSPGESLRHYSPKAKLILFTLPEIGDTRSLAETLRSRGERVGIMLPEMPGASAFEDLPLIFHWGQWSDDYQLARRLFAGLRELDAAGATYILCPLPAEQGIGATMRDRLIKARGPQT